MIHEFSRILERSPKFDFNLLTLRIGPFEVDEKKIVFGPLEGSRFTIHESRFTNFTPLV